MTFWVPDPEHRLAGVRLSQDVRIPGDQLDFHRADHQAGASADHQAGASADNRAGGEPGWALTLRRPAVHRMEYLLELRYADGGAQTVTDPGNPRQAPGAFGPKSVLEFPAYAPPGWLTAPAGPSQGTAFEVPIGALGSVPVRTWAPADAPAEEVLPLLVVHDGPEYDTLAGLTSYLSAGVAGGWLPRLRAALLGPGSRDDWYSANPRYARALTHEVLPTLTSTLAASIKIGMGTSLGALAALHAYCRAPDAFDALFLQSGSFFCPRFDAHERRFRYYPRVIRFVAAATGAALPSKTVPVTLTCGAIEENLPNNHLMEQALKQHGYPAELHELPDVHNYTAWRDGFDPHLTRLLERVCA